jgi:hypothetical protein
LITAACHLEEKKEEFFQPEFAPVMFIWALKSVTPATLEDTVKVNVAAIEFPGESVMPSLSHIMAIGTFALAGLQLLAVMPRVSERSPAFLT